MNESPNRPNDDDSKARQILILAAVLTAMIWGERQLITAGLDHQAALPVITLLASSAIELTERIRRLPPRK